MHSIGLDRKATKAKAETVLKDYRKFKEVATRDFEASVTASYSFEPKSYTGVVNKPIEEHVARQTLAQELVKEIDGAVNKIEDETYRTILIERYQEQKLIEDIAFDLVLSTASFYRKLEGALIEFAVHFQNGKLLVCDGGEGIESYMRNLLN